MKTKVNKKNIKEVTKELIVSQGYHHVNISEISKMTNIKRGAIYNYYKTKEDIYLDIIIEELRDYILVLNEKLELENDKENFINILVDNIVERKELLILQSIMLPIIEPNATLEGLVNFKVEISQVLEELCVLFNKIYSEKTSEEVHQVVVVFKALISGLYPMSTITKKQEEAIMLSNIAYEKIDFKEGLKKILYKLLK